MREFFATYAKPEPEKPKFKRFLLLALSVAVVAFCVTIFFL